MTVGIGDVCPCGDVALPGQELCAGCIADLQADRARRDALAREATAEHEQRLLEQDEAA